MISNSTNAFVDRIQQAVDSGVNVSVADIAYNNGADNTLVSAMYKTRYVIQNRCVQWLEYSK